ncbi:enoyl-CoA hydratase-related protein [Marinibactrum halimedae]|uniref:Methylglutaconyl-CoA hydratase n=1 Tax=Marinibactrum halimedae TaxID=1444977 RepID=A0AA37T2M4_9GAMM|nr:enoyl-CoA hydratase-related protein [Marinibactrum halimedae]MCD9458125.1 enoyl-CoA hydratase-related protein [Marinibactrum halimedae]GLS25059.1 methylglutaconyl-CoA hydratase [Marinibactrum halimedae]
MTKLTSASTQESMADSTTHAQPHTQLSMGENGVATLWFQRPRQHNAFSDETIAEINAHLDHVIEHNQARVLLIQAEGKSFCAGADLQWMKKTISYNQEDNFNDARALALMLDKLNRLSIPTIAVAQGNAFGGGVGVLCCCDMVFASTDALFCFSEVKLGLIPATICPHVVRVIGERAARRYFLSAESFTATTAKAMGLVTHLADAKELHTTAQKTAQTIAKYPPNALAGTKALVHKIAADPMAPDVVDLTASTIAKARTSEEAQIALGKFLGQNISGENIEPQ